MMNHANYALQPSGSAQQYGSTPADQSVKDPAIHQRTYQGKARPLHLVSLGVWLMKFLTQHVYHVVGVRFAVT